MKFVEWVFALQATLAETVKDQRKVAHCAYCSYARKDGYVSYQVEVQGLRAHTLRVRLSCNKFGYLYRTHLYLHEGKRSNNHH